MLKLYIRAKMRSKYNIMVIYSSPVKVRFENNKEKKINFRSKKKQKKKRRDPYTYLCCVCSMS